MQNSVLRRFLILLVSCGLILCFIGCDQADYKKASEMLAQGQYSEAKVLFEKLNDYEDSAEQVKECDYQLALQMMQKGQLEEAITSFTSLLPYKDSADQITECRYQLALSNLDNGQFELAYAAFTELSSYKDSAAQAQECAYQIAQKLMKEGKYESAVEQLIALDDYKDCSTLLSECKWKYVLSALGNQGVQAKASYNQKGKTVVLNIQIIPDNGDILITSTWSWNEATMSATNNCNIRIKRDSADAEITSDSSIVYMGKTALPRANGHFTVSEYTKGMTIKWDKETKGELKFSNGKFVVGMDPPTAVIASMVECLNTQLAQIAPLATMSDIGFEAY